MFQNNLSNFIDEILTEYPMRSISCLKPLKANNNNSLFQFQLRLACVKTFLCTTWQWSHWKLSTIETGVLFQLMLGLPKVSVQNKNSPSMSKVLHILFEIFSTWPFSLCIPNVKFNVIGCSWIYTLEFKLIWRYWDNDMIIFSF